MELCLELKHELIPLTEIGDHYYEYNPLAHENVFERIISHVVQAQGVFEAPNKWDILIPREKK